MHFILASFIIVFIISHIIVHVWQVTAAGLGQITCLHLSEDTGQIPFSLSMRFISRVCPWLSVAGPLGMVTV